LVHGIGRRKTSTFSENFRTAAPHPFFQRYVSNESATGIATDINGDVYVADKNGGTVKRIAAGDQSISVVAQGAGDDNFSPNAVAIDSAGNLFVADAEHHLVYRVDLSRQSQTTIDYHRPRRAADNAILHPQSCKAEPIDLSVDPSGNLFILDGCDGTVTKINAEGQIASVLDSHIAVPISTRQASVSTNFYPSPSSIAVAPSGDLYLADNVHSAVLRYDARENTLSLIAGNGESGYAGDGASASAALLDSPTCIRLDNNGNLYIIDTGNDAIREIRRGTRRIATIAVGASSRISSELGRVSIDFGRATVIAIAHNGDLIVTDSENQAIDYAQFFDPLGNDNRVERASSPNPNLQTCGYTESMRSAEIGFGQNCLSITPSRLLFGSLERNTGEQVPLIALANNGDSPIKLSSIHIEGRFASDFHLSSNCEAVLTPTNHCEITIVFEPNGPGDHEALLTVRAGLSVLLHLSGSGANLPDVR
jgi:sugar lactone lactonase YvrE